MLFIIEPVTREQWLTLTDASEHWAPPAPFTRPNPFVPEQMMTVRPHPESTCRLLSHGKLSASAELSPDDDSPNVLLVTTDNAAAAAHIAALFDASCAQLK